MFHHLFKKFVNQAVGDTQDFLQRSKDGIARAGLLFAAIGDNPKSAVPELGLS